MKSNRPLTFQESPTNSPRKWRWWHTIMVIAVIVIIGSLTQKDYKKPVDANYSKTAAKAPTNEEIIESICSQIKKDTLYGIKDVYYNKADSSLSIAISNKDNALNDKSYSTTYFDETYQINTVDCIDGVTLYAFKKHKSLKNGDYTDALAADSKRATVLLSAFKEKYCTSYYCEPLRQYVTSLMNDPDSFQQDRLWVAWNEGKTFLVTMSYRGKNGFGGLVWNKASAIVDMDGNVTDFRDLTN